MYRVHLAMNAIWTLLSLYLIRSAQTEDSIFRRSWTSQAKNYVLFLYLINTNSSSIQINNWLSNHIWCHVLREYKIAPFFIPWCSFGVYLRYKYTLYLFLITLTILDSADIIRCSFWKSNTILNGRRNTSMKNYFKGIWNRCTWQLKT